jgi:hypothetical protein
MRAQGTRVALLVSGAVLLVEAVPLLGHHSFAVQYDAAKPIEITGTVTKIEWTNPHVHFYVDVTVAPEKIENWNFEMASPNVLTRNGWRRDTLKVGSTVTVAGYLAKHGARMAIAGALTGADGKPLFEPPQQDPTR